MKININKKVFNNIYLKKGLNNQNRVQIYFGGASSGKSYFLAQRTVLDVLQGRNYLVVRQIASTIKKSIFNEIVKAIHFFKVKSFFTINKSDLTITCNNNNRQILFAGLDDPEKIKSTTPIESVITDILIEEATQIDLFSYKQLTKRLRGKSIHKKRITLAFNPVLKEHWIYKEFFSIWRDNIQYVEQNDVSILKTTYKDNDKLSDDDIKALENEIDKYYYEVYTLGNWGVLGALIFNNWKVEDFDYSKFDNIRNGIDWGFGVDPFAFVRLHIDNKKKELYIYEEIYQTELSDEDAQKLVSEKIKNNELITADSSEPKSISAWRNKRINIQGAKKGPGSIETGIKFLKGYSIIIHPKCNNTRLEFSKYKWKENKDGTVLPIPVDKDNHIIDAIRYATEQDQTGKKEFKAVKNPFF
jgi:phage terminase large subunit